MIRFPEMNGPRDANHVRRDEGIVIKVLADSNVGYDHFVRSLGKLFPERQTRHIIASLTGVLNELASAPMRKGGLYCGSDQRLQGMACTSQPHVVPAFAHETCLAAESV